MRTLLDRRALLRRCFGACVVALPGASRRASGQILYRSLRKPVVVPLARLADVWKPFPFRALAQKANGGQVRLQGLLMRVPDPASASTALRAFCLLCPHEICQVNFVPDPSRLRLEPANKPLFVCPCHFSVFDPAADGACLSGPAPRGLYRFAVQVRARQAEVSQVEQQALE